MAIVLGLLTALLWGVTDFLIRIVGRSSGVHRSMLYAQGFGAVSVGLWLACSAAARQPLYNPSLAALTASAFGAAPLGLLATVALYRGLQVGRVGLVSPIAGAYGAVTAGLSLMSGEAIGSFAIAAIIVIVLGCLLVSVPTPSHRILTESSSGDRAGALWATLACIGYGAQFWIQGRFAVPLLGPVIPVWIYYLFSTLVLAVAAAVRRPSLALSQVAGICVFGTGAVAVTGFLTLSAGLATGRIAIVTVLSCLQSAITVGLACAFLGERLSKHQWIGVGAIAVGLALLHLDPKTL
jgi:drug/metabolite transporter (DMT)-like permease